MTGITNIKRCGSCHFGQIIPQDLSKRLCHGAPPTAIELPAPRGQMTLKMARPVVSVTDVACALYRGKDEFDMVRDNHAIQQMRDENIPETKQ